MMKALTAVAALMCLGLGLPTVASASCYFIYKGDQLVYRSVRTPVDLSRQIHETMVGRFAGGHLTMIPDETGCPDLLVNGISEVYSATPGARSAIDASPLFRTGTGGDGSLVGGSPAQSNTPGSTPTPGDGTQTPTRRAPARGR
jgi:hypothetical protein